MRPDRGSDQPKITQSEPVTLPPTPTQKFVLPGHEEPSVCPPDFLAHSVPTEDHSSLFILLICASVSLSFSEPHTNTSPLAHCPPSSSDLS